MCFPGRRFYHGLCSRDRIVIPTSGDKKRLESQSSVLKEKCNTCTDRKCHACTDLSNLSNAFHDAGMEMEALGLTLPWILHAFKEDSK